MSEDQNRGEEAHGPPYAAYKAAEDAVWMTEPDSRLVVDAIWPLGFAAGYRGAIEALRAKDDDEAAAFKRGTEEHPENWDGWPYAHPYRRAADHLEAITKDGAE